MTVPSILEGENEPVAIVGMGCRWAGGVKDSPGLWELLRNKQDGWREFSEPRFPADGFYHPNQDRPGSVRQRGGFLCDEDPRLFDHAFFGMTGREVETMDPNQRKLLEVVYEAFENAGETWDSISGSRTGVYIGNFALDHLLIQAREWDYTKPYASTGAETSILANRLSYVFNLRGPSLATNTACSSSMYALHLAVSAIRSGDCDGAVVAAANWISDPSMQIVLDKLGALSPTSRCHTFDAAADGYARGEGFVALYLKKSSLAVLEELPIRAMIRGTAANANGKTGGITRPSARGQEDCIREAYKNAGNLPFQDTAFFECHGTGTPAGDPLEVSAVGNVFAPSKDSDAPEDRLLIGSIKPNLGHTEGASALASIMKVVLSLEAGEIPPTYGVQNLNPDIDFDGANVTVVMDGPVPWPKGKLRRASVNSFGFGGANGHCIIDQVNEVLPGYVKPGLIKATPSISAALNGHSNGTSQNGHANGHSNGHSNGYSNGHSNGQSNGDANGHSNGQSNGDANGHSNGHSTGSSNGNGFSNGNGHHHTNGSGSNESTTNVPHHSPLVSTVTKSASANASTRPWVVLPFSAHNTTSLEQNINALSKVANRFSLADIAYTLGSKRSRLQQRTFVVVETGKVASGVDFTSDQRVFNSPIQPSTVGFVFTGQGAQWHAMGAQLFEYGVFRNTISFLDHILEKVPNPPTWTIAATLSGEYEPEHIQSPQVSQVACTAVQIGIVDLLASWSVRPAAVVGHSSGEMAAAYASGYLTAAQAIAAAYFRGQALIKNTKKGAMLAVGLGVEEVSSYLEGREEQVVIAAINSPGSVTLSGDADAIEALSAVLSKEGVFNRILRTSGSAYHSHHMLAVGSEYLDMLERGEERLRELGLVDEVARYPKVPWASSVKPDKVVADGDLKARYWRENLESPVRFTQAVTKMMTADGIDGTAIDVLVEIGPHAALKGPVEQILKSIGKPATYVPSLQRNEDGVKSLLQLAGTLFAINADIDMPAVNATDSDVSITSSGPALTHGCLAVDLPAYQYTYGPVSYYESRISKEYRIRDFLRHDLLGSEVLGSGKLQPQWRNVLRAKDVPWLSDHRLVPDAVFPAAGFIAVGVEAAMRVYRGLPGALEITGYSFRNVDIDTALRIPEDDYGVEVIISLDVVDTATAKSPAWAKFTVTSVTRDSSEWTQHCTGLVRVEVSPPAQRVKMSTEMDPRFPSVQGWYGKFHEIGLEYRKTFQPLSDLQVDPHRNLATATVALNTTDGTVKEGESSYPLHPAALDAAFQLAIIAFYGGELEKATTAFVPVHLSQLYLKAGLHGEESASAVAQGSIQGLRSAQAHLQMLDARGDVFLEVDMMRFASFKETKTNDAQSRLPFSSPFTRLEWKPDIRTLSNDQARKLFPPPAENAQMAADLEVLEMICSLVAFEIHDTFVTGTDKVTPKGDIRHWLAWVKRLVEEDQRAQVVEARKLSPEQRREMLQQLYTQVGDRPEAKAAQLLHENAADILHERRTGIDVLISNMLLTPLYEVGTAIAGSHPQVFNIIDSLAHANPNARILEIGAGTGSATRGAMKALAGPNGIKRYADYTFTDISAGFLAGAKEMLAGYRDIHYSVLDIEQDPMAHGYEPVYDIVLACEAIHATASMERTLAHCRSLLKPGGTLVLAETTRMRVLLGLLYGTLTGYWQHEDARTEGPFMNLDIWQRRLQESGFSGVDIHVDDYEAPHATTSVLVTTRVEPEQHQQHEHGAQNGKEEVEEALVYLLHDGQSTLDVLGQQLVAEFARRGTSCRALALDSAADGAVPPDARVVALLSDKNDLFDTEDAHRFEAFQHLARNAKSMVWLTSGGIIKGQDPRGAFMAGLLRVLATENPAGRFVSINVEGHGFESADDDLTRAIVDSEASLQQAQESDGASVDSEFAWQDGWLGDYSDTIRTPAHQGFDMRPLESLGAQKPVRAAFETAGVVNSLYFRSYAELLQPLPVDHIEVQIAAAGLNWKDVSVASGREGSTRYLSSEYAGTVTMVGTNVIGLSVGDRVYGIGKGHFGNYERVPAAFAQRLQLTDDLVEAATMPIDYASALYAFDYVTRLRKSHSVLIQAAAEGLGLAAIQIARSKGANIFAIARDADEASFLADTAGIQRDHIISSSDGPEALVYAARATSRGGFDAVLSILSAGEEDRDSLYHLIKAVAPMGHLIDVGGRLLNMLESMKATENLEMLRNNSNFSSFDIGAILDNDAELGAELMKKVHWLYQAGQISPVHPVSVTSVSELDQTLLALSKGTHVGKTVVSFQGPTATIKLLREPQPVTFDSEALYIITGGLGGLGRSIIRWMADRGARHFVTLSRRGAAARSVPAAQLLIDDMEAQGVNLETMGCDVSQQEEVMQTISLIKTSTARPIRGVVHAVLSLSDLSFDKLTMDQFRSGTVAKTLGSINLHEATLSEPLAFFVMLTSTETIWAPPTQAAYIAADNFATYFARFRRSQNLPASTVSYGFVHDLGSDYRATSHGTEDMYARNLACTMTEHQALAALEPALVSSSCSKDQDAWAASHRFDPLSAATYFTCLSPLELASKTAANVPRWHRDGRVALLMRAVADARRHASSSAANEGGDGGDHGEGGVVRQRRAFDEAIKAGADGRDAAVVLVTGGVCSAIAEMLFIDVGNVNPGKSVAEHGVDSLIAAELRNWFLQALRADMRNLLDSTLSIRALAEGIIDKALAG
ncbi:uncharacterized protein B0H64DRAFT_434836 [Chaetomium fimeti]|uniref:Carrier domain-containing protein n=1 Tax=Chaetomium fimeti TaxID=1854472 RepID=A0AAE0HCG1_9PEZI|nr:hypothetical protein B0H64DRAFT_434836 [Chaetomium fimeti]